MSIFALKILTVSTRLSHCEIVAFHGKTEIAEMDELNEKIEITKCLWIIVYLRARLSKSEIMRNIWLADVEESFSRKRSKTGTLFISCNLKVIFHSRYFMTKEE